MVMSCPMYNIPTGGSHFSKTNAKMEPLMLAAAPLSRCYPPLSIDIIQVVSSFLDPSPWWSMVRAAGSGSTRLSDRVLQYLKHHSDLFWCDAVRKRWFVEAMRQAIVGNDLAMVQHLHFHHAQPFGMSMLEIALTRDRQEIFAWLLINRDEYRRWVTMEGQKVEDISRLRQVLKIGKLKMSPRIRDWLSQEGFLTSSSTEGTTLQAIRENDVPFLQQLHTSTPVQLPMTVLDCALQMGCFDAVQWLCEMLGLELDKQQALLAWVAQRRGIEPFFPPGFRASLRLADFAAVERPHVLSAFPAFEATLQDQFSIEDAGQVPVEQRVRLLNILLHHQHFENLKWLGECCRWSLDGVDMKFFRVGEKSVQILELLRSQGIGWTSLQLKQDAAKAGRLDIIKWIHKQGTAAWEPAVVQSAAACGRLGIVQWFHDTLDDVGGSGTMDAAASGGHVHILQWLQSNRSDGSGEYALLCAAQIGHVDAVAWLHRNGFRCQGEEAFKVAIGPPSSFVLEYLLEEKLTTRSLLSIVADAVQQRIDRDFTVQLIEYADAAGVKLPSTLLDRAVFMGLLLVVDRLCTHLQVDSTTHTRLMNSAVAARARRY